MNVKFIELRIREIAEAYEDDKDDQTAHTGERCLHVEVLMAIAYGAAEDPRACAEAVLKTSGIKFERRFA